MVRREIFLIVRQVLMRLTSARILVVDDDARIRQVVRFALEQAGFGVVEAADGAAGLARFAEDAPDLIVLDINMSELDGTEVCRRIRRSSDVPILFLSSRDEEIDRVLGLELGADDYVTKPFSPRELLARVRAILRRAAPGGRSEDAQSTAAQSGAQDVHEDLAHDGGAAEVARNQVSHGNLLLDLDLFLATWRGQEVVLTRREFALLQTLLRYPGKVYSRDELMQAAYGHDTIVSDRTIDSHIRRVRRKFEALGAEPVETVHGVGYRLGKCR